MLRPLRQDALRGEIVFSTRRSAVSRLSHAEGTVRALLSLPTYIVPRVFIRVKQDAEFADAPARLPR